MIFFFQMKLNSNFIWYSHNLIPFIFIIFNEKEIFILQNNRENIFKINFFLFFPICKKFYYISIIKKYAIFMRPKFIKYYELSVYNLKRNSFCSILKIHHFSLLSTLPPPDPSNRLQMNSFSLEREQFINF